MFKDKESRDLTIIQTFKKSSKKKEKSGTSKMGFKNISYLLLC